MSHDDGGSAKRDKRREHLVTSLRENLKRRKTQQRLRVAENRPAGAEERPAEDGKTPSPDLKG